jgi:cytidylate kinase
MSDAILVPSIEGRLSGLIEVVRRVKAENRAKDATNIARTITISREFGCEAYPAAEKLKQIMELSSGESWTMVDRSLVNEVARHHDLQAEILHNLGKRPRWLDDMLSSLSTKWKNEREDFQLLAQKIVSIASGGNVIIVGMGGAIVTQSLKNCIHFRIFASSEFKIASISRRAKVSAAEAVTMIEKRQKAREKFVRDFLDRDINDMNYFNLILNNDRCTAQLMAETMAAHVQLYK